MTALAAKEVASRSRALCRQLFMVILINVPTVSLGLAMGWVSLASGEGGADGTGGEDGADGAGGVDGASGAFGVEGALVAAAASTFVASLAGVPLSARALACGRKFATIATSVAFVVCWSLKLAGNAWAAGGGSARWWWAAARLAAGLGGAGAYTVPPLLAREMCEGAVSGAAVSALVVAHNLGILLMYIAADIGLAHRTVLWSCLGLSVCHCFVFLFVPESPAFLAANGKHQEARASLAWLRGGAAADSAALVAELAALPPLDDTAPLQTLRELFSDRDRRRAFIIAAIAVVGQESCGIFTLIQFAERTFVIARDEHAEPAEHSLHTGQLGALVSPARYALLLGIVQLLASVLALYLVEKVGRRPLLISTALATSACLWGGAGALWVGLAAPWVGAAVLALAVGADSAGLQPVPYALLVDMFHYKYRSSALLLATGAACAGNALETALFPLLARAGGLPAALATAAALTLAYAAFAVAAVPETRGHTPEQIYRRIAGTKHTDDVTTL